MSNTIQIKHGYGIPNGKLQPYELGYSDDQGKFYIGGPLQNGELGAAIPLTIPSVQTKTLLLNADSPATLVFNSNVKAAAVTVRGQSDSVCFSAFWDYSVSGAAQTLGDGNNFSVIIKVQFSGKNLIVTLNGASSINCSVTGFF